MIIVRSVWLVIALSLLSLQPVSAQFVEDAIDFFTIYTNRRAVQLDSSLYPAKIIMAPVVSYAPETSLGLGVGAKYLFKMRGSGDETRTSNMPLSLRYTLENQIIAYSGYEIFFNQEKWMLEGNLLFRNFPRLYYGIGRDTPESNEETYDFSQILVEPILLKRVAGYLFAGVGIRYNHISNVKSPEGGLLDTSTIPGAEGSTSVGAQLAVVYDNRDNLINAHNGWFIELTHGFYDKVLGGTQTFQLTRLDLRHYMQPFENRQDVIAFQLRTHFSHGNTPLAELAQLGGEEIMRGYYEGRYIDQNMIALQAEYRMNFTDRLGGVFFIGAGDVNREISDFRVQNLRLSIGGGLRFLLDKKEDLNIRFDFGFGKNTNNYYLNIAEAF